MEKGLHKLPRQRPTLRWGIMAVLFIVGLMNLGWMAALSVVISTYGALFISRRHV